MITRWLITGGCGFIGRNLIQNLCKEGEHAIRIIDNLSVGTRQDLSLLCECVELNCNDDPFPPPDPSRIQLIVGDILDEELALKTAQDIDIIVHLAANTGVGPSVLNPRMDCITNVTGTLNFLEAARISSVKRFVFASSGAPVGECNPPIHEELPSHPVSPYGASKLAGEGYCSAYYQTYSVETVALRFSNVYGPLSTKKNSVVAKFIKLAFAGKPCEVYGDGNQTRDFIYINDLISAIRSASSVKDIGGQTFQIAAAKETTIKELISILSPLLLKINGVIKMDVVYSATRPGDVKRNFSDTTKAKTLLGWQPNVALNEGLKSTIEWFLKSRKAGLSNDDF